MEKKTHPSALSPGPYMCFHVRLGLIFFFPGLLSGKGEREIFMVYSLTGSVRKKEVLCGYRTRGLTDRFGSITEA